MEIRFDEITDQQYADLIAYFAKKKLVGGVNEIVIHSGNDDIVIEKKPRLLDDTFDYDSAACAACFALIASSV